MEFVNHEDKHEGGQGAALFYGLVYCYLRGGSAFLVRTAHGFREVLGDV